MAKMKTYRISATADDKYKVTVTAGERTLYVDQPQFAGGSDAGATPMDYLFASLAGCLATTARIIATQKKLDLRGMAITVEGSLDLDIIYGKNRDSRPGLSGLHVTLDLDAAMAAEEREDFLAELRRRCPVYDSIKAATPVTLATPSPP